MFGFLKKKLKDAVEKFTGNVEEEVQEEQVQEVNDEDISKAEEEVLEEARDEEVYEEEEPSELEEEFVEEETEDETKEEEEEEEPIEEEKPKDIEKEEEPLIHDIKEVEEEVEEEIQEEEQKEDKELIKETEKEIKEELEEIEKSEFKKELDEAQSVEKAKEAVQEHFEDKEEIDEEIEEIEEKTKEVPPLPSKEKEPKKKNIFSKIFGKKDKEEAQEEITQEDKEILEEDEIKEEQEEEPIFQAKKEPEVQEEAKEKPLIHEIEEVEEEIQEEIEEVKQKPKKEKKGLFTKFKETFTKKTLSEDKFDELFWELEVTLLENNVAVEVIEKIKENLKEELTTGKVSRMGIDAIILQTLKSTLEEILSIQQRDIIKEIKAKEKKPYVVCFVGINGSGKTTNLAKLAHLCKQNGLSVVAAACDTFRAAAIQQLEDHTNKLDIKLIKQDYGADAAAVAFDAIKHAESKNIDVVLIDTAGRLHSNTNLMDELKKIIRVANPDFKIFVGEATTGNDCVEQATQFNEAVEIDGSILAKADVDDKGGAAISLSHVTGKPILYLGVGQEYKDLEAFDPQKILKSIGL